jgi:acetylornithine deacetylase/succinyl-diaminopimelate desuccinylase-like protein
LRNDSFIIRDALGRVSADLIRAHIKALEGPRHPSSSPLALEQASAYIWDSLQSLGFDMMEHLFSDSGSDFRNIVATRPGLLRPEERVIVVAHFDTVATSPGADDNASGVAVMLEVARILGPLRFARSIQFIGVNLEENGGEDERGMGRRGSRALAAYARENGWEIEGIVVLESVAYAGDSVVQKAPAGIPVKVPETGNFIAVVGNEGSLGLVRGFAEAIERYGVPLPCQTMAVPGTGEALPDSRRSDHASFWDEGYRAIMITDTTNFRSPHYHLPGDTLETLNIPFAAQVCKATGGLVAEMARFCGQE